MCRKEAQPNMKVSQLIKQLQDAQAQCGDVDVYVHNGKEYDEDNWCPDVACVTISTCETDIIICVGD